MKALSESETWQLFSKTNRDCNLRIAIDAHIRQRHNPNSVGSKVKEGYYQ